MNKDIRFNAAVSNVTAAAVSNVTAAAAAADSEKQLITNVKDFFKEIQYLLVIPPSLDTKDSYSDFLRNFLQVRSIQRGKISCILNVKPPIMNIYKGMHGGAVAAVAELLAYACARTIVGNDKDLFLAELGASYLSAAPENAKLVVEGSVVKSGRNVTAVIVEFKLEDSRKLIYITRATFYNMPVASL